jgi:hypothetical protein
MFRERIKVGVFCGFGNNPLGEGGALSEKDFAYQVLCVLDHGQLSDDEKQPSVGQERLNRHFLRTTLRGPFEFLLPPEWYGENPWKASRSIVEESDIILAIFPKRPTAESGSLSSPTSLYVMLEVALAHGSNKPIMPIVEDGVEPKTLSAIQEFVSWRRDIARDRIQEPLISKSLCDEFRASVEEMLVETKNLQTLGLEDVDRLYLHLTETLIASKFLRIYNHSALPIGSGMDPFNAGTTSFCDYSGVLSEPWHVVPHRALYFEVEEALSNGDWDRVNGLLVTEKRFFDSRDLIVSRIEDAQKLCHRIKLQRVASVVCAAEYEALADSTARSHQRLQSLARITSIVAQLWRQRRAAEEVAPTYTLKVFPTISTQSAPTTLYAELRGDRKSERGIWGFLRGPGERADSFIYAQNHEVVMMWREYVDRYFGDMSDRHGVRQVHANGTTNLHSLFDIIGARAAGDVMRFFPELKLQKDDPQVSNACVTEDAIAWYENELKFWSSKQPLAIA